VIWTFPLSLSSPSFAWLDRGCMKRGACLRSKIACPCLSNSLFLSTIISANRSIYIVDRFSLLRISSTETNILHRIPLSPFSFLLSPFLIFQDALKHSLIDLSTSRTLHTTALSASAVSISICPYTLSGSNVDAKLPWECCSQSPRTGDVY